MLHHPINMYKYSLYSVTIIITLWTTIEPMFHTIYTLTIWANRNLSIGSLPRWPCPRTYPSGAKPLSEYLNSITSPLSQSTIEFVPSCNRARLLNHWTSVPSCYPISLSGEPLLVAWAIELMHHPVILPLYYRTTKQWVYAQFCHPVTASGNFCGPVIRIRITELMLPIIPLFIVD